MSNHELEISMSFVGLSRSDMSEEISTNAEFIKALSDREFEM